MRIQKSSRWAAMLLASVVAILTFAVVANATQTITTPNAAFISFSLAASANSTAITPATNRPVLVMGCCTSLGGVGQVSLLHITTGTNHLIEWVGLESTSGSAITEGESSTAGDHIVYIDVDHFVDIRVASPDTILIHNATGVTLAGNVTLIW